MKAVFADTLYWVALELVGDPWHKPVVDCIRNLGTRPRVTTQEVLTEYLNTLSSWGEYYRLRGTQTVNDILEDIQVTVIEQSEKSFLEGIALYRQRLDKGYSLTDCISMNTCRTMGITEVLTADHHFTQEGFTILIKR